MGTYAQDAALSCAVTVIWRAGLLLGVRGLQSDVHELISGEQILQAQVHMPHCHVQRVTAKARRAAG